MVGGGGWVVGGLKGMYDWGLTSAHDITGVYGSGCVHNFPQSNFGQNFQPLTLSQLSLRRFILS